MTEGQRSATPAPTCQFPGCIRSAAPISMVVSPDRDWEFVWLCELHRELVENHPISAAWATEAGLGEDWARKRDGDRRE